MSTLRWGILSAGLISHDFLAGFAHLPKDEHKVIAVAARNLENAEKLAKVHNVPKSYGSYEELVNDAEIDVVYIGSINPAHLSMVKLSLENGKHVLCEKPLGMNVKETKEMFELAKSKNLFLMEAIWTRFFPLYTQLRKQIDEGSLGEILHVLVTMGQVICGLDRLSIKELGGGTVLDLGIYCVQFAEFVFNERPLKVISGGQLNFDGVDECSSTTLIFSKGRTATLVTHSRVDLPNEGFICGTKETLKVRKPFWAPTELEEMGTGKVHSFPLPEKWINLNFVNGQGMHYECTEVRKCILEGKTESEVVSHEKSLIIAEIMEQIRKQIGVIYSQD